MNCETFIVVQSSNKRSCLIASQHGDSPYAPSAITSTALGRVYPFGLRLTGNSSRHIFSLVDPPAFLSTNTREPTAQNISPAPLTDRLGTVEELRGDLGPSNV